MKTPKIKIESDIPIYSRWMSYQNSETFQMAKTLQTMKVGQSFLTNENKRPYRAALYAGCVIVTRKLGDGNYRVWLASKTEMKGTK